MTQHDMRRLALRRHREALQEARFYCVPLVMIPQTPSSRYIIQGACRREASYYLAIAAQCRAVYANTERIHAGAC